MDSYQINHTQLGIQIEGIPDGHLVVALESPIARRIADLALHRDDLEFALSSLNSINSTIDNPHLREALWRSSILHFFKCFDSKKRFNLQADQFLKLEGNEAKEVFLYFKSLRHKHFVHDENSYKQGLPFAVLNKGNKSYKVEKIVCLVANAQTLEQSSWANLHNLINTALAWVISEFNFLTAKETFQLEKMSYEQLSKLKPGNYKNPAIEEVHFRRR
jgi:hypothetical protein